MPRPTGTKKNGLKFLDQAQVQKLRDVLKKEGNIRDEIALRLTFRLGLRVQELANIRQKDIDFDAMQITINGVKNGRTRTYDLEKELWSKITRYVKREDIQDRLFPVSAPALKKMFKKYAKKAGLSSEFSIHSLRHSLGISMAQAGASPIFIMKWLRHRDIKSSQTYFEQLEDRKVDQLMNDQVFPGFM